MGPMTRSALIFWAVIQFGCSAVPDSETLYSCAPEKFTDGAVLVLTTNYETSSLDLFHPDCPGEVRQNRVVASGDAVLRKVGSRPVIVNRGAESNLMLLSEDLEVRSQVALSDCGPHDLVSLDEDHLLVSCYESSQVQRVNLSRETVEPWLDLSDYAGSDGFPEMDALAIDENYIYVTLQNLDRRNNWIPEKPGTLLVFNRSDRELYQEITLPCDNPYTGLAWRANETIWLGCAGTWSGEYIDAGIVSLSTRDWTVTTLYDGVSLNGRPTALDSRQSMKPLVVSAKPEVNNAWDIEMMQVLSLEDGEAKTVYAHPGFSLGGIHSWSERKLLIAQRTYDSDSGVLLLNLDTAEAEARWKTGLLPSQFIVSD